MVKDGIAGLTFKSQVNSASFSLKRRAVEVCVSSMLEREAGRSQFLRAEEPLFLEASVEAGMSFFFNLEKKSSKTVKSATGILGKTDTFQVDCWTTRKNTVSSVKHGESSV